ncbi:hypothetical protein ACFXJ8_24065 [Nonomuraea sp. NPDC059194]|uniref:hypothetical protein n=1 Tax=Nonomuraea sp. NPDC059194 TaxID=3346764 RepID=UPI003676CB9B
MLRRQRRVELGLPAPRELRVVLRRAESLPGPLRDAVDIVALPLGQRRPHWDVSVPAGLPAAEAESARNSLEGALAAGPSVGGQLLASAREAYTNGLNVVAVVCAAIGALLALTAMLALRRAQKAEEVDAPLQTTGS